MLVLKTAVLANELSLGPIHASTAIGRQNTFEFVCWEPYLLMFVLPLLPLPATLLLRAHAHFVSLRRTYAHICFKCTQSICDKHTQQQGESKGGQHDIQAHRGVLTC